MRLLVAVNACTIVVAVGACTSFAASNDDGPADGGGSADAAASETSPGSPGSPDSGRPDADASSCTTLISDDFATQRPEWRTTGDNQHFKAKELLLTPAQSGTNGAVWWNAPVSYSGYLRVTVGVRINTPQAAPKGDGLAIAWVDDKQPFPPALGGLGKSLAVCAGAPTTNGYAIGARTGDDTVEIVDTVACDTATPADHPAFTLEGEHTFVIEIRPASIATVIDGTFKFERTNLGPQAATSGYLGLTASSSSPASTGHSIVRVVVERCPN